LAPSFQVWVAANDRSRAYGCGRLADGCPDSLPISVENSLAFDTVRLIEVPWFDGEKVECSI